MVIRSPTANRLLRAADSVIRKKGLSEATYAAIGAEAKEHASLIAYYFGSRNGLLEAVIDRMVIDPGLLPREKIWRETANWCRVAALLGAQCTLSAKRGYFKSFYELVPHILNSRPMRKKLLARYRRVAIDDAAILDSVVGVGREDSERLALLGIAILDGLGLQGLMGLENDRREAAYDMWGQMIKTYVASRGAAMGKEECPAVGGE